MLNGILCNAVRDLAPCVAGKFLTKIGSLEPPGLHVGCAD